MNLQCSVVSAGHTSAEMCVINHGSSVSLFFKSRLVADILNDVFRYLPSKSFQASTGVVPYQILPRPDYCTSFLSSSPSPPYQYPELLFVHRLGWLLTHPKFLLTEETAIFLNSASVYPLLSCAWNNFLCGLFYASIWAV
jgi:hypothetical protein